MTQNRVEVPKETNIPMYIIYHLSVTSCHTCSTSQTYCNSLKKVTIYGRNLSDCCVINTRYFGTIWWQNLCIRCGHSYGNKHTALYTIIQRVKQCMFTDNNTLEPEKKLCLRMQQNSLVPECHIFIAATALILATLDYCLQ
jgi:hypothetical protein